MSRPPRTDLPGFCADDVASLPGQLRARTFSRRRRAQARAAGGGLAAFLAAAGAAAAEDLGVEPLGEDSGPFAGFRLADSAEDLFAVAKFCATSIDGVAHSGHAGFDQAMTSWLAGGDFASRFESRLESHFGGVDAHQHRDDDAFTTASEHHSAHTEQVGAAFSSLGSGHTEHSNGAAATAGAFAHAHVETASFSELSTASVLHAAHDAMSEQASELAGDAAQFGLSSDHQVDGSPTVFRVHDAHVLASAASDGLGGDVSDAVAALVGDDDAPPAAAQPLSLAETQASLDLAFNEIQPAEPLLPLADI
ncbi:MAG: hypothetical protein WD076_05630 [Parvularculaceae bacterium]